MRNRIKLIDMDDLQLIAAANRGDQQAMTELYQRHRSFVVNLAWRYLEDRDEAEDVMQECFAYLFSKFPGFVLTCELRTFLFPVVRNKSISRLRRRKPSGGEEGLEHLAAGEAVDEHSQRQRVSEIVSSLSDEHREVILLRFVDGLSLEEIARQLTVPKGTVKSRLHNALSKLRRSGDFIWLLSLLELSDFQSF